MSDHLTPVRTAVTKKTVSVGEAVEKREPSPTIGGLSAGAATVESSMVAPQKIKNGTTLQASNSTAGYLSEENAN